MGQSGSVVDLRVRIVPRPWNGCLCWRADRSNAGEASGEPDSVRGDHLRAFDRMLRICTGRCGHVVWLWILDMARAYFKYSLHWAVLPSVLLSFVLWS